MARKKLNRVYRTSKLTAKEAARDRGLRCLIEAEFPPLEAASPAPVLSGPLKDALVHSAKSLGQLANEAGVSRVVLAQFLAGERDLRLATAEKVAKILGMKLVEA